MSRRRHHHLTRRWCLVVALAVPLATTAAADPADAAVEEPPSTTLAGTVHRSDGTPAAGATVDVLAVAAATSGVGTDLDPAGGRQRPRHHVGSALSDDDGRFAVAVPTGRCYLLRVSPPGGVTGRGPAASPLVCTSSGSRTDDLALTVPDLPTAWIGGRVVDRGQAAQSGTRVGLQAVAGDGSAGSPLATTSSDESGWYGFDVAPGCYQLSVGGPATVRLGCVADGARLDLADHVLAADSGGAPALSAVEHEIVRLTNGLRTDPDGPLAREASLPACVDDGYFRLDVDPETGQPSAVPALTVDIEASRSLSRHWAVQLGTEGRLRHRPSEAQLSVYADLGRQVDSWGENIARADGFRDSDVARIHFEGWRESDAGHYCSLLTGRFTRIGVGAAHIDGQSWAVQNFYSPG